MCHNLACHVGGDVLLTEAYVLTFEETLSSVARDPHPPSPLPLQKL